LNKPSSASWCWPSPPFQIALHQPEIPPNTGNIARLCAATASPLHLIEPLGFAITDKTLKRAGLDYWEHVNITRHASYEDMKAQLSPTPILAFSTKAERLHTEAVYPPGAILMFGCETRGLPAGIREELGDSLYRIPMFEDHVRSINLASSVSIVLYEALRQFQTNRTTV
jgi:tRNA (cytidine/uridine-2'-O-)-methyltransferase